MPAVWQMAVMGISAWRRITCRCHGHCSFRQEKVHIYHHQHNPPPPLEAISSLRSADLRQVVGEVHGMELLHTLRNRVAPAECRIEMYPVEHLSVPGVHSYLNYPLYMFNLYYLSCF
jgi:hypothetical protein